MLYSEITYISGKVQTIMFRNDIEANDFYNQLVNYKRNEFKNYPMIEVYDNGQEALINIMNIEHNSILFI